MKTQIKVAGTTFHPLPEGVGIQIVREYEDTSNIKNGYMQSIPCAQCMAVLQPEPENEYDPEAVKVLIPLKNGQAFHIGYIPKAEPVKWEIKVPTVAQVEIRDYGQMGNLNPSFVIIEIQK